jgi:HlyD family secretion protein
MPIAQIVVPALMLTALATGAPAPEGEAVKARRGPFRVVHEAQGVFIPASFTEISVIPEAYEGELRIVQVVPHGSRVRQGDVILRLEDEKARDMLKGAEWGARTADRGLEDGKIRRAEFDSDAERDVARAEKELAFAEKGLKGYLEVNRPLDKDETEQTERFFRHVIEDQEDEIAQLGKMYKEDQLTEETEEIVLKRSKRQLEQAKKRLELFLRRYAFGEEYQEPQVQENLKNNVKDKTKVLKDLRRGRESARVLGQIEIEKLEHEVTAAHKRVERLRDDLDRLTVRAPQDGIVLHASFEEKVAVNILRKNQSVSPRQTLLSLAHPGSLRARFSLPEKDRFRLGAGTSVKILPEALPEMSIAGSLEPVVGFPLADNTWNAHVVFAHEDERLLPLLKCKVVVVLLDAMDVLTVPAAAVTQQGDRSICYVRGKSPFGIAVKTVVVGPSDGKLTVIREGLSEDDEVLLQEPQK